MPPKAQTYVKNKCILPASCARLGPAHRYTFLLIVFGTKVTARVKEEVLKPMKVLGLVREGCGNGNKSINQLPTLIKKATTSYCNIKTLKGGTWVVRIELAGVLEPLMVKLAQT